MANLLSKQIAKIHLKSWLSMALSMGALKQRNFRQSFKSVLISSSL